MSCIRKREKGRESNRIGELRRFNFLPLALVATNQKRIKQNKLFSLELWNDKNQRHCSPPLNG